MNICIFGNQDNAGYRLAKWLRARGNNAHLYLMTHWESPRSNPEAIDNDLTKETYPTWTHKFNNSVPHMILGNSREIDEIERTYDVVLVVGNMAMTFAHQIRHVPIVCLSTGPGNQGVIKMWDHYGLKYKLFWTLMRFYIRKSVRSCQKVLIHYDPEIYSLKKLDQLGKAIFYGMPEDVSMNKDRVDKALLADLNNQYAKYDKVFLWLSRIDFRNSKSPMYKGTDKFIRGAAKIIAEGANVKIIMGSHGQDYEASKDMVTNLDISGHVDWVPHLPFWKMLTYLSIDNAVIFDELTEFNCVSSGMFREALSVGAVLVRSYSETMTNAGHGGYNCPVHHAVHEADVYEVMKKILCWDKSKMQEEKNRSFSWAEKYLKADHQIDRLINILEEAVYCHSVAKKLSSYY